MEILLSYETKRHAYTMPKLISNPIRIEAAGAPPKTIEEYAGRVTTQSSEISIARMASPAGWKEPAQTPEFDEYTVVLKGKLKVETGEKIFEVSAGQAIIISKGEWVRYSSPNEGGAEYISVCIPAFSPETVHRESE